MVTRKVMGASMMRQHGGGRILGVVAMAAWSMFSPVPAWAGYNWGGDGVEVINSGTIPNGANSFKIRPPG
jgi:hypothetical protein